MKSKAHGKKCQAMGVSESSLDDPESEEAGKLKLRRCPRAHSLSPPSEEKLGCSLNQLAASKEL